MNSDELKEAEICQLSAENLLNQHELCSRFNLSIRELKGSLYENKLKLVPNNQKTEHPKWPIKQRNEDGCVAVI